MISPELGTTFNFFDICFFVSSPSQRNEALVAHECEIASLMAACVLRQSARWKTTLRQLVLFACWFAVEMHCINGADNSKADRNTAMLTAKVFL